MAFYLLFLLFTLFVLFINSYYNRKNDVRIKLILWVYEFLFIIIYVFRYDVGWDYPNYFDTIKNNDLSERLEPLSYVLYWIASACKSPVLLFVLYGIPTYLLIFSTIKKYSVNVEFSLLIYICLFFLDSLGLIRQSLAVAIVLWGYTFLVEKKPVKFFLVIILASCFHYSAVSAFIIYPVYHARNSIYIAFLFAIVLMKEMLFYIIEQEGSYAVYLLDEDLMTGGRGILFVYVCIVVASIILLYSQRKNIQLIRLYRILLLVPVFYILFNAGIAVRIVAYFVVYMILFLPLLLQQFPKLRLMLGFCLVCYWLMFINVSMNNPVKSPYTPYKNIFINYGEPFK